ncbi:MAG: ATP-binding protein [Ekhidna sp.]|uniref:ATP-binding protein n=1 Tax=Ekhidna sp. TaxID=2608089 RepID=UPI0032EE1738
MKATDNYPLPLSNFLKTRKFSSFIRSSKSLGIVFGEPGYGKTTTFKNEERLDTKVKYYRVGYQEPSKIFYSRVLLDLIGNKDIDLNKLRKSSYLTYLIDRCSSEVNERKHIELIIIDEAGNFSSRYLPHIRQLWDNINQNCGVLVAGPLSFMYNLKKWRLENRTGIHEMLSRVGNRILTLESHKLRDTELFCSESNIHDPSEINYFHSNSKSIRDLEILVNDFKAGRINIC